MVNISLLLVRHGQSVWNAEGKWQGQADPPLSKLGERQAEQAGRHLAGQNFAHVFASDLIRARRTAEILAAAVGHSNVVVDPGLREFDVGEWCGFTRPEIEDRWPGMIAEWTAGSIPSPPGGEDREAFTKRALDAVSGLARASAAGDRLLVVTHGGLIRALVRGLGGQPQPVPNLNGWSFDFDVENGTMQVGQAVDLLDPELETVSPSA